MTSEELFTLFASPAARVALVASLTCAAGNDNEPPAGRPCEHCGRYFESGVFLIVAGRVVEITCAECEGLRPDGR